MSEKTIDNFPRQPPIAYGFVDMDGNKWCDLWVDSYNRHTQIINNSQGTSPLCLKERNIFLDQRHQLFVSYMEICRKERERAA